MTFQEIHDQFAEASRTDPMALENPLVVVFVKVILELSAAGIQIEKRVTELEAELETYKKPIDFPKLREGVAHVDNSLSDFLEDSIKRAAARP